MVKKFSLFIILLSFLCLALTSETDCDYVILLDDYDFSILNCTFTTKGEDKNLEIYYNTTANGAKAKQLQYILTNNDFNRIETMQTL
jgi:hypothetical protein